MTFDKLIYYLLLLYAFSSSISIAAANVAISFAALFALIRHIREPISFTFDKKLAGFIFGFLSISIISSLCSDAPLVGVETVWGYLYRMFPLLLTVLFVKRKSQVITILSFMLASICIADGYAIWQGIHGNYRALAFNSNPMIFAGFLILMIPFLLVSKLEYNLEKRLLSKGVTLGIVLSISGLSFNGTRGAWLAVSIFFLCYFIINMKKNLKISLYIVGIFLLSIGIFSTVPHSQENIKSMVNISTNNSNIERILLWQSAWEMFKDYPLLGIGPGRFREVYNQSYISPHAKATYLGHAHNNFLHVLVESGILGLLAFAGLTFYLLYSSYMNYRRGYILSGILFFCTVTLLIQGLTEFNFGDSAVIRMYWFIVGIAQAELSLDRNS